MPDYVNEPEDIEELMPWSLLSRIRDNSDKGAQYYLDVMSFLSTGQKHEVSVFDALTAAFAGNAEIVLA